MSLPSPLGTGAALFQVLRQGGGEAGRARPPPRCQWGEVEEEGSQHPQVGARLPKVNDGDIFDPGPAHILPLTPMILTGRGTLPQAGLGGWPTSQSRSWGVRAARTAEVAWDQSLPIS